MLQWTEEKQALLDMQKAIAMAWRMNRGQLHSYCIRLREYQPQILPGRLGSEFLMILDEIADMEYDAESKIWTKLVRDAETMLKLTQQQQDRQAWLHALSRLEMQQGSFFQTKLGDSFIRVLKEKLGLQMPETAAGYSRNNREEHNRKDMKHPDHYSYQEMNSQGQRSSKEMNLLDQHICKNTMLPDQEELEKVAAWLMDDADRQQMGRSRYQTAQESQQAGRKKQQATRKSRQTLRHAKQSYQSNQSKLTRRFGILMPQQTADWLDRTVVAVLACASLCLLSIWVYGQVQRNQSFWDAQRMKATAAAQQDEAENDKGAGGGVGINSRENGQDGTYAGGGGNTQESPDRNIQTGAAGYAGRQADAGASAHVASQEADSAKGRPRNAAGSGKRPKILTQYREMAKEYPGLFGWLQIPDTQISLPVMQPLTEQNFYLDHDFTGAESAEGALFTDPQNSRWPQDDNIVIYGHNMKNGHMFGMLSLYENPDYFHAHREISFDTIYETGIYETVAVLKTRILNENEQGFRYYQFFQYDDEKEFAQCVDFVRENQLFDTGSSLQYGDQILMLSTCEYSQENGRLVLVSRKK